jgi:hypothetical protein
MKKKVLCFFYFLYVLLISSIQLTFAQFQQLPISQSKGQNTTSSSTPFKLTEEKFSLPFWDDFSSPQPDPKKWINNGTHVSRTAGNAPPSLGVLVLDGVNELGRPYSNVTLQEGFADAIQSQPISLLSTVNNPIQNVYLSFFWQAGGKGELPDVDDFLSLQFLGIDGKWETVWEKNGGQPSFALFFTQENIRVDSKFFHENFQFRFLIRGKLSGPFDSWLLDYVYLNKDRSDADFFTEDRALSMQTTKPYKKHTAVPLFEIKKHQQKYLGSITNEFKNLNNRFRAMDYSIEIREKKSQQKVYVLNNRTAFNPVPLSLERRSFTSKIIEDLPLPIEEGDYEILTYLSTGDGFLTKISGSDTIRYQGVDFRTNDSLRVDLPIRDFLAYDDGQIDYAAGINQRSGMLALKYEIFTPSYLKGISINFPNTSQRGSAIDLMIWSDLTKEPIYLKSTEIPSNASPSEFSYFEIQENVKVEGIFYIGFMQFTNNFIYVGLDKSNDAKEDIFYNVTGNWEQNKFVSGALMMRPHLSETALFRATNSTELQIMAYPNPVTDKLFIEGELEITGIYDSFGRKINVGITAIENKKELNFMGLQKGIYLITMIQNQELKTLRIMVK